VSPRKYILRASQGVPKYIGLGVANSISFLRIYQPDIWEEKIDWKTIILKNLYKRTLPDITYISSNSDIYNVHDYISSCIE